MKFQKFFGLGLLLFSISFQRLHADPHNLYVNPGTVHVDCGTIFVDLGGRLLQVHSISSDDQGLHIPNYDAVRPVYCTVCCQYYDADNYTSECRNGVHSIICQVKY